MDQLDKLSGCQAHTTVILSGVDVDTFKRLGVQLTSDPEYQTQQLFHR